MFQVNINDHDVLIVDRYASLGWIENQVDILMSKTVAATSGDDLGLEL